MSQNKHLYRVWLDSEDRDSSVEVLLTIQDPEWAAESGLEQILWNRVSDDFHKRAFDSELIVVVDCGLGELKRFSVSTEPAFSCTAEEVTE